MTPAHTPGPWTGLTKDRELCENIVVHSDGKPICEVYGDEDDADLERTIRALLARIDGTEAPQ